jgi:antitoxin CptB
MLTKTEKARIAWHCRRGMLELDLILQKFFEECIDKLDAQQIASFNELLSATDPELFAWFMGHEEPTTPELVKIVSFIRNHT